jgi:hypothetical protein
MNANIIISFDNMLVIAQELKKKKEYHDSLLGKTGTDAERQKLMQEMQDLVSSMTK